MCKPSELIRCEVLVHADDTLSDELPLHSSQIVPQKNIQTVQDLKKKQNKTYWFHIMINNRNQTETSKLRDKTSDSVPFQSWQEIRFQTPSFVFAL